MVALYNQISVCTRMVLIHVTRTVPSYPSNLATVTFVFLYVHAYYETKKSSVPFPFLLLQVCM